MAALRIPLALASGLLFSLAVFLALFTFVDKQFEAPALDKGRIIEFKPLRRDTPLENKRDPKVERPKPAEPTVVIDVGVGRGDGVDVTPVRIDTPVAVDVRGGKGLAVGTDRDVLPLVRVAPDYPPRALASGIEGWVQVRFTITPTGSVRDAVVVASEPRSTFDDAALKAIARWRYNPRIDGGETVERVGMQTVIRFTLND
jgi:periplasmic protein TonB